MKKVLLVFGTRPEAIKMCPLLPALREAGLAPLVCVTGQHRELLWQVLDEVGVCPDYDLAQGRVSQEEAQQGEAAARRGEGGPGEATDQGEAADQDASPPGGEAVARLSGTAGRLLSLLPAVHDHAAPDVVLVHGDTISAYAAAVAAFLTRRPIGHVEAGLRTGSLAAPFPEEFCRRGIDGVADFLFAPTEAARENLLREGRAAEEIDVTGNTGIDALRTALTPDFSHPVLDFAEGRRLLILTLHRRESLGGPMRRILRAVRRLVREREDACVFFPCHPNPAVRAAAEELAGEARVLLGEPPPPRVFANLLARCYAVLTDSGGLQEEAPYFGKPVLVLRERTERGEGVRAGVLRLVGTEEEGVLAAARTLLASPAAYAAMARATSPFGDGYAAPRIAAALRRRLGEMGEKKGKEAPRLF